MDIPSTLLVLARVPPAIVTIGIIGTVAASVVTEHYEVKWVRTTKTAIFADAKLLSGNSVALALAAVPLMVIGTLTGSTLNKRAGERSFTLLFWTVMAGYTIRLGTVLF